jgi:hypothetical protein
MPEPKLIPIYDATAAIASTITNTEIPERIALIERMRTAMTTIDRTPTGLLLHFPNQPDVRADLGAFAVDEKRCCQFWGFDERLEAVVAADRYMAVSASSAAIAPATRMSAAGVSALSSRSAVVTSRRWS